MWLDILPTWFVAMAVVGFGVFVIAQVMTDTVPDKRLFDKHADVTKWVSERLLWFGIGAFVLARLVSVFAWRNNAGRLFPMLQNGLYNSFLVDLTNPQHPRHHRAAKPR